MAANNAFEADGPKSVASAISVFPPLRSRPPAQRAADGHPPGGCEARFNQQLQRASADPWDRHTAEVIK